MDFLVDSHCHLADLNLPSKCAADLKQTIDRAHRCGVTHFLCVACTPKDYAPMLECIKPYPEIFNAVGVHPLNLEDAVGWHEDELLSCIHKGHPVAVGEMGLDYHYAPETRLKQMDCFARQLNLAKEVNLPVIIHARQAHHDTVALMRSTGIRDVGGVMHCFCDEVEMARECLDLGFYISFSGIATFRNAANVREVLKYVPLDRMLVETDCPYLAPVPVRGQQNEPAFVRYTLEFAAAFKGVKAGDLAKITSRNFEDLFKVSLAQHAPKLSSDEAPLTKIEPIARPL